MDLCFLFAACVHECKCMFVLRKGDRGHQQITTKCKTRAHYTAVIEKTIIFCTISLLQIAWENIVYKSILFSPKIFEKKRVGHFQELCLFKQVSLKLKSTNNNNLKFWFDKKLFDTKLSTLEDRSWVWVFLGWLYKSKLVKKQLIRNRA